MCDFISWIEKDNKVYYLTSEDLASKRGKQLIKHTQVKEDLVGHGAIRWFYGEFKGGIERECTDFSSPDNFPKEIVEDIKAGKFKGMGICAETLTKSAYDECQKIEQVIAEEYEKIEQRAYEEYEKIRQSAYEEYRNTRQTAYEEYEKLERPAYAEYGKIDQSLYEEYYEKIEQAAYKEYKKIEKAAYKEYEKIERSVSEKYERAMQKAFWKIFSNPENRIEEWR